MNNVIKMLLLTVLFLNLPLLAFEYRVKTEDIQLQINKNLPITKKFLFLTLEITEAIINIDEKSERVAIECHLNSPNIVVKEASLKAKIIASSEIIFKDNLEFFIEDIIIENIESPYLDVKMKKMLSKSAEVTLNSYFSKYPVYDLKNAPKEIKSYVGMIKEIKLCKSGVNVIF